jgi:hypothetical protein
MLCRMTLALAVVAMFTLSVDALAEEKPFVLPAVAETWKCPFEPFTAPPPPPPPPGPEPTLPEPDDAAEAKTNQIIGKVPDLVAVVSGVKVSPGDKIQGKNLTFKVEKITKDAVHLKVIEANEKYKKYVGRIYIKKIVF